VAVGWLYAGPFVAGVFRCGGGGDLRKLRGGCGGGSFGIGGSGGSGANVLLRGV